MVKVLIAVDGSDYAEYAVQWYVDNMHKKENEVNLAHCMEFPSVPSRDTWEMQTKSGKDKGGEIEKKFSKILQGAGINCQYFTDFEKPGEFVVSKAREIKADVIVMGTRGMGKIRRTLLGSVSDFVVSHAPCPVLICRNKED